MATVDLVFAGGSVFTAPERAGRPADVAVDGGRVVAVAPAGGLDDLTARTRVDLRGRLLIPGFQDAHVHPLLAGVSMLQCDLHGTADAAENADRIRAYARRRPDVPWIVGAGWHLQQYPGGTPTRQELDALLPDRPALLVNRDRHGAWANSLALRLAGITAATDDPPDGRIEREPDGGPAGTLHEGAVRLVERLLPPVTAHEQLDGLLAAQERLLALGITAWQDAAVGEALGQPDQLPVYLRADREGLLVPRVVAALWWDRDRGGEQVSELAERRAAAAALGGRVTAPVVKIMLDGVAENFTAAMTEPYLDRCGHGTANTGLSFVDAAALRSHVAELERAGFAVHLHALGDRAVRDGLDAIAAARAEHEPRPRHHLAHLQVVHPDDVPRFAALGATANLQMLWAVHEPQMDELTIPFLGERRSTWQYPFGDLARSGARLAAGSDWPVSDPNPLAAIHAGVNRSLHGEPADPFLPGQALDLATALTAYTAGSAYVNHLDPPLRAEGAPSPHTPRGDQGIHGTRTARRDQGMHGTGGPGQAPSGLIRPGAAADLAVLDRDPFAHPADEIGATRVVATYVDGRLVAGGT